MLPKWIKRLKDNAWLKWLMCPFITWGLASAIVGFILQKSFQNDQPPTPKIIASSYVGTAPHTVMFDATSSSDPEGEALSYRWRIDDKVVAMQPYFTFTFNEIGENRVELTVTDSEGHAAITSVFITTHPPTQVNQVNTAEHSSCCRIDWNKDAHRHDAGR